MTDIRTPRTIHPGFREEDAAEPRTLESSMENRIPDIPWRFVISVVCYITGILVGLAWVLTFAPTFALLAICLILVLTGILLGAY